MISPFAAIARYYAVKAAHTDAESAKPHRRVRGTFGQANGTIPGLAPKEWNGARFAEHHGGAYSKAAPSLLPVESHAFKGGKVTEPRTTRGVPRGRK